MIKNATKKDRTVLWWILWITATIASFFLSHWIWTPIIAAKYGSVRESHTAVIWVAAVFGTWLIILLPLIVAMYYKVDKAYEDARIRREKTLLQFRSVNTDRSRRVLPADVRKKISRFPKTIQNGKLVNLTLRSGEAVSNVFIFADTEIAGVYDRDRFDFSGDDVKDAEPVDMNKPPFFVQSKWLRLDGAPLQQT